MTEAEIQLETLQNKNYGDRKKEETEKVAEDACQRGKRSLDESMFSTG